MSASFSNSLRRCPWPVASNRSTRPARDSPRCPRPPPARALPPWRHGPGPAPHPWTLQQQEESIRAILKAGIATGDPAAGETATAIVSLCITAGIDLRDTLTGDQ